MPAEPPAEPIESRQNARVKRLRQAFSRSPRADDTIAAIEGEHLLQEALRARCVTEIFLREDAVSRFSDLISNFSGEVTFLAEDPFNSAVATEAPQGIAAFVQRPLHTFASATARADSLVVLLDGVQDPGNVGTIVRSAEAFGAAGVVALTGTASAWNLKAIRASAGSIFRLPVFALSELAAEALLLENSYELIATVAKGGLHAREFQWQGKQALLIGSEGRGLSPGWLARCQTHLTLPTDSAVESLNAAVAASILLYEASKYRELR